MSTKTTSAAEIERMYRKKREREEPGYQARLEEERRWEDDHHAAELGHEEEALAHALSRAEVANE